MPIRPGHKIYWSENFIMIDVQFHPENKREYVISYNEIKSGQERHNCA
jgi:hypothetical protein